MATWKCPCQCHNAIRGDYFEARQHDDWASALIASHDPCVNTGDPVDASDVQEAAVASGCPCLGYHVIALSDSPPTFLPPQNWKPDATGEGDE